MSSTSKPPAPPEDIEKLLIDGKLDQVEEEWMSHIEKAPADLDWFTGVAHAVAKADSKDTSTIFQQMLDDHLVAKKLWPIRIELLRRSGRDMFTNAELHDELMSTLEKMYGERPHFTQMVSKMGLHKAKEDIPKTWQKAGRLENLMAFEVGTIVRMGDKGSGTIKEVNMALESFKVKFESGISPRIGFAGAAKLLDPLAVTHVLRRKIEEPEKLKALRDESPSGLLRLVLESEGKALTGAEIKKILVGIVPPKRWNSWWNAARKHPQVLNDPKNKKAYIWAASTEDAEDAVWQAFQVAKPLEQLSMLRRDGERDETLKRRMSTLLWHSGKEAARRNPGLAWEIYLNLDRAGITPPSNANWTPDKLIVKHEDLAPVLSGIEDRTLRDKAYALVRKERADWPQIFSQMMWHETDARNLDTLADSFSGVEPDLFDSFFDQLVSQPRKAPATFVWLLERSADRPEWLARNPTRLMKQLLVALAHEDFSPYRAARMVQMVESGGTLPRLLDHLKADQAETALDIVKKAPALEDYQREPLSNAIYLRFPNTHQEREAALYATDASISRKRKELKQLAEEELPENRQAIETAREMGDLRENFEYHAARKRHEYLSIRAGELDADLRRVRPIVATNVTGNEIVVGAKVGFIGEGGERTFTLLGPWESDPENRVLSNESDLAQRLLGKKVGDTVELPDGEFEVTTIEPFE